MRALSASVNVYFIERLFKEDFVITEFISIEDDAWIDKKGYRLCTWQATICSESQLNFPSEATLEFGRRKKMIYMKRSGCFSE